MSHNPTNARYAIRMLLNYLVGAIEQGRRDAKTEGFRRPEVDHQLELGWLLDWKVGRIGSLQYLVNVDGSLAIKINKIRTIGYQPAHCRQETIGRERWEPILQCQFDEALAQETR